MEKIKLGKHNHTFTDLLKVLIFALVMLAPFGAVLSKCLYVATNKNAKDSYSGQNQVNINYKYETNEVNTLDDLVVGNIYKFSITTAQFSSVNISTRFFQASAIYNAIVEDGYFNADVSSLNGYTIAPYKYALADDILIFNKVQPNGLSAGGIFQVTLTDTYTFYFVYESIFLSELINYVSISDYIPIDSVDITQDTLDNVFNYAVEQLPQIPIFAWTKNTALYNGVLAMTNGLGFDPQNNVLALLLTYWSLNTIIYIIFDIVIKAFTTLTHMIGNK